MPLREKSGSKPRTNTRDSGIGLALEVSDRLAAVDEMLPFRARPAARTHEILVRLDAIDGRLSEHERDGVLVARHTARRSTRDIERVLNLEG